MLPAEQEPIHLPAILSESATPEGRRIELSGRRKVDVPTRYLYLWDQVKLGASIYDLCHRLRARAAVEPAFLEVGRFLCFLVDQDLVDDVRLVRLADSLRGQYEWPSDLFSVVSWVKVFKRWGRSLSRFGVAATVILAVLATLITIPFLVVSSRQLFQAVEASSLRWVVWVVWALIAGTLGRSSTALVRGLSSRLAGDAGEFSFRFDLLGPHLGFEPYTITGAFRRACDFLLSYSVFVFPLWVLVYINFAKDVSDGLDGTVQRFSLSAMLFVVAMVNHPRTRSQLTLALRVWNRSPMVWREDDELREVEGFYLLGSIGSITLFVLAIAIFLLELQGGVRGLRGMAFSALTAADQLAWAMSALLLTIMLVGFAEPFFTHELAGPATKNRRRRLWATKPRVLSIAGSEREAWAELPMLRQLTAPLRQQLLQQARLIHVQPGAAVCKQGKTDRSLYIVLDGKLAVAKSFQGRRRKVVAMLSAGAVFGETAFFFANPRTADVVAMEPSRLIEIRYQSAMQTLDLSANEEFQFRVWLLQALAGNTMLRELPSEAMDTLIFAGRRRSFKAGEVVFTEGAPAEACYFIAQGRASALQGGRKISEISAGEAFGEIALLKPGLRRTATIVADSDLLCMELEANSFWSLLASRLPLGVEIERLALRRLRADHQRRDDLV